MALSVAAVILRAPSSASATSVSQEDRDRAEEFRQGVTGAFPDSFAAAIGQRKRRFGPFGKYLSGQGGDQQRYGAQMLADALNGDNTQLSRLVPKPQGWLKRLVPCTMTTFNDKFVHEDIRDVSNANMADGITPSIMGLSNLAWAWGQFIDHVRTHLHGRRLLWWLNLSQALVARLFTLPESPPACNGQCAHGTSMVCRTSR